jgi:hypothetical protein
MAGQTPYIDITIDEEGNIISEVHGVLGPGCEGLVDWVKDLGTVEADRKTRDYGREPDQGVRTRVRAGS